MWEKKPALLLVLALVAILVGTIITMVMPFFWVNTEGDRVANVTPYTPLELEGRDIYIREGCNNCHTQTVRPLDGDVLRHGPYSRSGEFVYDRPFLWGSRRMGPDLHRIGGKYPDGWHERHMVDPKSIVPSSNMPKYGFLNDGKLDPGLSRRKMETLGFPYDEGQIEALAAKSEMDAMIAYLQKLGTAVKPTPTTAAGELGENPFDGDSAAAAEGAKLYADNCAACHGVDREGDIGPELAAGDYDDGELFEITRDGIPSGGMPAWKRLGDEKIWKIVTFIQSGE